MSVRLSLVVSIVVLAFGQGCCSSFDLPRNGTEYFAKYGLVNATDAHLCFDAGVMLLQITLLCCNGTRPSLMKPNVIKINRFFGVL